MGCRLFRRPWVAFFVSSGNHSFQIISLEHFSLEISLSGKIHLNTYKLTCHIQHKVSRDGTVD